MRRSILFAALAIALPVVAQAASGITVPVDQTRRLPIAGAASSVTVGSTLIADVRVIDSRTLMIIGKKQGVTNIVVMDALNRTLYDGEISVTGSARASTVIVFNGSVSTELACSPYCQAASGAAQAAAPLQALPVTVAPVQEAIGSPVK